MPDAPLVTTEQVGHVLRIGLNRAEKRNAFNLQVIDELAAAYQRLQDEDDLRVGLLFAHGDHFSAGLDLAEVGPVVAEQGPGAMAGGCDVDPFGVWKPQVTKPVVMALQGISFTVTIELALASDIVIAAQDARFRQLEIGRGIMPFGGATFRAPLSLGWGNAMRFLLTAEEFDAAEAYRIGLVQEVVPVGRQVDRAMELATLVAQQAPLGVYGTLANARIARAAGPDAAIADLAVRLAAVQASDDAREGIMSFIERREGNFTGR